MVDQCHQFHQFYVIQMLPLTQVYSVHPRQYHNTYVQAVLNILEVRSRGSNLATVELREMSKGTLFSNVLTMTTF